MRLDFSNSQQAVTFLWSILLGVAACLLYDVLRFLHKTIIKGSFAVFLGDIIYFSVISVITFCFFILFSKGVIRMYVYFGELLGFILCRKTLSRLIFPLIIKTDQWIRRLLLKIFAPISKLSLYAFEKSGAFLLKIFDKLKRKREKAKQKKEEKLKTQKKMKKVRKNS